MRLVLGLLKGAILGGAVGYGAQVLGFGSGGLAYLAYAVLGALVGVVGGKPIWRQETLWTPALKGLVGAGIAMGLFWVSNKVLGGMKLGFATSLGAPDKPLAEVPMLLGPLIGTIYGIFVEVDDGGPSAKAGEPPPAAKPGA